MKKSVKEIVYGIVALGLAFGAGYTVFRYQAAREERKLTPVPVTDDLALNTVVPQVADQTVQMRYVGYIRPVHQVDVLPNISGYVTQVNVQGGQTVHAGDVLLVIDRRPYEAALASARAAVSKAEAAFNNAALYDRRLQKATTAVSPTEKDNARADMLSSKAVYDAAVAAFETARINLDYTVIRAPIDGVVGNVSLTRGAYVAPSGESLFSIMAYNPVRAVFSITGQAYLSELKKTSPFADEKITLRLADGTLFEHIGRFAYWDNAVEPKTDSVAVYVEFENDGRVLMPEGFVEVLVERTFPRAVLISKNLVELTDRGNFVFLIRNGRVVREQVSVLSSKNDDFIVADTFKAEDLLVTDSLNPSLVGRMAHGISERAENDDHKESR
jgi:RND family efflux transporter MFP subunit